MAGPSIALDSNKPIIKGQFETIKDIWIRTIIQYQRIINFNSCVNGIMVI